MKNEEDLSVTVTVLERNHYSRPVRDRSENHDLCCIVA